MNDSDLVCIQIYASPQEARLDASMLQSHGLTCTVTGDQVSSTLSWFGLAIAKIELWTLPADAEAACRLLEEYSATNRHQEDLPWEGKDNSEWVCVECGESNAKSFDECWSCGRIKPDDPEWRAGVTDQQFIVRERSYEPVAADDASPYRSPTSHTASIRLAPQHDLVRRTMRSAILAIMFPPLAFYSLYLFRQCCREGTPPVRVWMALIIGILAFPLYLVLGIFPRAW